jgi:formylglycine-generating enzyme required for sulfatase activity
LLRGSASPAVRSGLFAALGLIDPSQLAVTERQGLADVLRHWYVHAPDGGTHSAAGFALRRWRVELPAIAPSGEPGAGRDWFINRQQMTMLRIQPGAFTMGDPQFPDAPPRAVQLSQPFFICDRETWLDLFRQFINDPDYPEAEKPRNWRGPRKDSNTTGDCPVSLVSWYDALQFCNWLSRREGRQPCYLRHRDMDGRDVWELDPTADGYRLPTEAEWEFACRAGTTTAYSYGDEPELMPSYGIFYMNSRNRAWPGANRLPNNWGLFDMHGNVEEWCWDNLAPHGPASKSESQGTPDSGKRFPRGGSYLVVEVRYLKCAARIYTVSLRDPAPQRGFRVVCGMGRARTGSLDSYGHPIDNGVVGMHQSWMARRGRLGFVGLELR